MTRERRRSGYAAEKNASCFDTGRVLMMRRRSPAFSEKPGFYFPT